jgi:hypothetical protein
MTRLGRLYDWWTRPCGGREVLQVSLPLVVSTISTTVMIFIDRMFLLWYAPKAMAAAMPAGMLHFTVISFPLGVALYVNTFVAQYEGAGRPRRSDPTFPAMGAAVRPAVSLEKRLREPAAAAPGSTAPPSAAKPRA